MPQKVLLRLSPPKNNFLLWQKEGFFQATNTGHKMAPLPKGAGTPEA